MLVQINLQKAMVKISEKWADWKRSIIPDSYAYKIWNKKAVETQKNFLRRVLLTDFSRAWQDII